MSENKPGIPSNPQHLSGQAILAMLRAQISIREIQKELNQQARWTDAPDPRIVKAADLLDMVELLMARAVRSFWFAHNNLNQARGVGS